MINANYYRIRTAVIRGLNEKEIDITDKELVKYKRVIDSFTPQQMGVFQLLVEQCAVRKSNENLDRFASGFERSLIGYLSEVMGTWDEVLKANEKVSEYLIDDSKMETKLFKEYKGDIEKMGAALKITLQNVEARAKTMVLEGKNQKQAIQELKDEFPEVSNSLISSTYKKVLSEATIDGKRTDMVLIDEVATTGTTKAIEEVAATEPKLILKNRLIEVDGENGSYMASIKHGIKLELPENVLCFNNEEELYRFTQEIKEVFRMVNSNE